MTDSPTARTPYEVLGVSVSATHDEVRRAYRRRLRETHPDTGGTAELFNAVQVAWQLIGETDARSRYDAGDSRGFGASHDYRGDDPSSTSTGPGPSGHSGSWTSQPTRARSSSVRARSYGHPGGRSRERFLRAMREWVGRGAPLPNPYDPALVRSAPREVRRLLAKALAEEATAAGVAGLGVGFTVWHGALSSKPGVTPRESVDHIVLGPSGLYAVESEDWGGSVSWSHGEVVGEGIPPRTEPVRDLRRRVKGLSRMIGIKFTAILIVVPDEAIDEMLIVAGRWKPGEPVLVRRSVLPTLLREGVAELEHGTVDQIFELRSRLLERVELV